MLIRAIAAVVGFLYGLVISALGGVLFVLLYSLSELTTLPLSGGVPLAVVMPGVAAGVAIAIIVLTASAMVIAALNETLPGLRWLWALVFVAITIVLGALAGSFLLMPRVGEAFLLLVSMGLIFACIHLPGIVVAFVVASATQPAFPGAGSPDNVTPTGTGLAARGFMLGINAATNLIVGFIVYPAALLYLNPALLLAGIALPIILAVISLLPAFSPSNTVAQGVEPIIGWSSALMPSTWFVTILGVILFLLSCIGQVLAPLFFWAPAVASYLSISGTRFIWLTGSILQDGGVAGNSMPGPGANGYNLGTFSFFVPGEGATPGALSRTAQHEIGHNLSAAVFGSTVHLIGWIDEGIWYLIGLIPGVPFGARGAYMERLAESNVSPPSDIPRLPIW